MYVFIYIGLCQQECNLLLLQLHRRHYDEDDLYYGKVLLTCGYFNKDYLVQARKIFEKHGYREGLAELLYNLAEKNQYNRDFGELF